MEWLSSSPVSNCSSLALSETSVDCLDDSCSGCSSLSDMSSIFVASSDEDCCSYDGDSVADSEPAAHHRESRIQTFSEHCLIRKLHSLLKSVADGKQTPSALYLQMIGKNLYKSKQFARQKGLEVCCILETVYQLVSSGQMAYQRDTYYRYKSILKSVDNVRKICKLVATFLDVLPAQLNIVPCPKGMVFGNITIELKTGIIVSCLLQNGQVLPYIECVQRVVTSDNTRAIVVVEKQTAFLALLESGFARRFPWAVLVTGKGYPDINTRKFLSLFDKSIKVYVLVDYDPDGAHIYKIYAEGGQNSLQHKLVSAHWAGLHCSPTHIAQWKLDSSKMIEFTLRDRRLALQLMQHWKKTPVLCRRMAKMIYCGKKIELEVITQHRSTVLDFISSLVCD